MMNGNYGGAWMWGGWMMFVLVLVCVAVIGAVAWLVMRSMKNKQATPHSSPPQYYSPSQMDGQGYQPPSQPSTETYQEGEKQYSYPQSVQYPQQQEQPLN